MKYFYIRKKKKIVPISLILEEIFLRKCNISEISFYQIMISGKAISERVIMKLLKFMEDEI